MNSISKLTETVKMKSFCSSTFLLKTNHSLVQYFLITVSSFPTPPSLPIPQIFPQNHSPSVSPQKDQIFKR